MVEEGGYLSGTITLEGTDIKSLPKEKLRRRVGMVFQQPIAFPHSIEKNLSYVLKYHGVRNKKEIAEKITESLQKAKLYDEVKDQLKKSGIGTGERADTVYVIKNEQMSLHMTFTRFSYLFRKGFLSV